MGNLKEDQEFLDKYAEIDEIQKKLHAHFTKDELYDLYEENIKDKWMRLDRLGIREFIKADDTKYMKRLFKRIDDIFDFYGDPTELHMLADDILGFDVWARAIERYFKLRPPYVRMGTHIPPYLAKLHRESRQCFIYGNMHGCVALSRAVVEASLKNIFQGTDKRKWSAGELLRQCHEKKLISSKTYVLGKEIADKGNLVLHEGKSINEKQALHIIDITTEYIEDMYFKPGRM